MHSCRHQINFTSRINRNMEIIYSLIFSLMQELTTLAFLLKPTMSIRVSPVTIIYFALAIPIPTVVSNSASSGNSITDSRNEHVDEFQGGSFSIHLIAKSYLVLKSSYL